MQETTSAYLHAHTPAERRARLLEAAAEVGRSVTAILNLAELLPHTVDVICEAYGFDYAVLFLIERDQAGKSWAVLRAARGEAGQQMLAQGYRLEVGSDSLIGAATGRREAHIAMDEIALPLVVGDEIIGALGVQNVEQAAFTGDDVTALQAMADMLAVAIANARLLAALEATHRELVRAKTFEATANATLEALHWIGNKATPIPSCVARVRRELASFSGDPRGIASAIEDLALIESSAALILEVQENLIGPAREQQPSPVMLQDVLKDAIVALAVPEALVHYQVADGTPLALADPTQMHRVFTNLIKNALEAMRDVDAPRLNIEVGPGHKPGHVTVTVADNGCGIPAEILDRIWAAFFTTKGSHHHSGLGLTACLQIMEQLEGEIRVESQIGLGTTFALDLPAANAEAPAPLAEGSATILIVDDADAWSRFAAAQLAAAGYEVLLAPDQADYGLPALRARLDECALIIIDDLLERANALAVVQMLRGTGIEDRLRKTVIVTSNLRVERTREHLKAGVRDVLAKPYSQSGLAALLDDALEQKSQG